MMTGVPEPGLDISTATIVARIDAGETVREIGILVLVFAPLDAAFTERPTDVDAMSRIMVGALLLIIAGIILETGE